MQISPALPLTPDTVWTGEQGQWDARNPDPALLPGDGSSNLTGAPGISSED